MDYWEAIEVEVTKAEAVREVEKHGIDKTEFFAELGEKDCYQGKDILDWLGY